MHTWRTASTPTGDTCPAYYTPRCNNTSDPQTPHTRSCTRPSHGCHSHAPPSAPSGRRRLNPPDTPWSCIPLLYHPWELSALGCCTHRQGWRRRNQAPDRRWGWTPPAWRGGLRHSRRILPFQSHNQLWRRRIYRWKDRWSSGFGPRLDPTTTWAPEEFWIFRSWERSLWDWAVACRRPLVFRAKSCAGTCWLSWTSSNPPLSNIKKVEQQIKART